MYGGAIYAGNPYGAKRAYDPTAPLFGTHVAKVQSRLSPAGFTFLKKPLTLQAGNYAASAYVFIEGPGTATLKIVNALGTQIGSSVATSVEAAWTRIGILPALTADLVGGFLEIIPSGNCIVWVDGVLLERNAAQLSYFDGTFDNCSWEGTPDASYSNGPLALLPGRTLLDSFSLSDSIVRSTSKKLADLITIVEVFKRVSGVVLSDVLTLSDRIARSTNKVFLTTFTLVSSLKRSLSRTLSETVSLSDSVKKMGGKLLTESITITSSLKRAVAKTITSTFTLASSITRSTSRHLVETFTLVEFFSKIGNNNVHFSDILTVSDSLKRSTRKVMSDALTISDTIKRGAQKLFANLITIVEFFRAAKPLLLGQREMRNVYNKVRTFFQDQP